jgi:ComF family protein
MSSLRQCGSCLRHPPPVDRTIAALDYAFPWDRLLQRFKFNDGIELQAVLLDRLEQALQLELAEAPDWLLAVPLSGQRQRERGYNQSHQLAKVLARRHQLRCDPDLLLRVRSTRQQAQLALHERAANMHQAFAVEPARQRELRGSHVAIVDDVMTSGATLFELARVLRRAGATRVQAWVIARTPGPKD